MTDFVSYTRGISHVTINVHNMSTYVQYQRYVCKFRVYTLYASY